MVSSHAFGLPQAYALGEALGRIPGRLVVLTVDIADVSYGVGLHAGRRRGRARGGRVCIR